MMQYPNQNHINQHYQNKHICNTENCKRCYKKNGCPEYLVYLESIVTSTIPITTSIPSHISQSPTQSQSKQPEVIETTSMPSDIDLSSVNKMITAYQDLTIELITDYTSKAENKFKSLLKANNVLSSELSELRELITGLNEKISKLDSFIEMIEIHNAQAGGIEPKENSMTIYSEIPEPEKILVEKSKKGGFLGFGKKTEWVEE